MPSARKERARTLVLCFDGTNDRYDDDNTNIVKLVGLLKKDDPEAQMVYYQTGIGTWTQPGLLGMVSAGIAKAIDMCIAWWIDAHVIDGYQFLMRNHRKGDKICIFGFSRGAYCGRALAGMLHKVGLLPKDNEELCSFAFDLYKKSDKHGFDQSRSFKEVFCKNVEIEFLGVWDTVSSVGILFSSNLPFTASNRIVKTFRHAVSLDEHRAKFTANLWHKIPAKHHHNARTDDNRPSSAQSTYKSPTRKTDVLEVFFAGGHADVGGGNDVNETLHSLSNISLRWMLREIVKAQCGILFDNSALKRLGIPQSTFYLSSAFRNFKPNSHLLGHQFSGSCPCGAPQSAHELSSILRRRSARSAAEPWSSAGAGDQGFDMGVVQDVPDDTGDSVSDAVSTVVAPDDQLSNTLFGLYTKARDFVRPVPVNPDGNCTFADHYRMSCEELDAEDALLGQIHDELHRQPLWWILEFLPVRRSWQQPPGEWHHSYWPNLFRARHLPAPDYQPHVHHTVLLRRKVLGYEPRIDLSQGFIIVE